MEIPLLTPFREEDFGYDLQQMSSFFSSDLDKFKSETQLKTLIHIVDENKLEAYEVLKLVKLILLVPTAKAVNERQC